MSYLILWKIDVGVGTDWTLLTPRWTCALLESLFVCEQSTCRLFEMNWFASSVGTTVIAKFDI